MFSHLNFIGFFFKLLFCNRTHKIVPCRIARDKRHRNSQQSPISAPSTFFFSRRNTRHTETHDQIQNFIVIRASLIKLRNNSYDISYHILHVSCLILISSIPLINTIFNGSNFCLHIIHLTLLTFIHSISHNQLHLT